MDEIDLRSDTVTKPTIEMREAMYRAEVGDDVYSEDLTVIALEKRAAEMLGKEAGLFVTSGTMGNLVAVLTHTQKGDEIILEEQSHIYYYEVGGISAVAGVIPRLIRGINGIFTAQDLKDVLRIQDLHLPRTRLVCLENSHNRGGGSVYNLEQMAEIRKICQQNDLSIHLDGARIFNAAIALGVNATDIAYYADSVMFCLSKGLGSPVGSLLVGNLEWIERARKWRKMLGGGLRQAGVLAAAGLVSLNTMVQRLTEDHKKAYNLADAISRIEGLEIQPELVNTNIVIFRVCPELGVENFLAQLRAEGVLANQFGSDTIRFVTHKDVSEDDIEQTIEILKKIVSVL